MFRSLKSQGFNLQQSHMTERERVEKLFMLVSIAFLRLLQTGIYIAKEIEKNKILAHTKTCIHLY